MRSVPRKARMMTAMTTPGMTFFPSKPGIRHRHTRALNIIGMVREFETLYHDMPGYFIGQCVLTVELIFLFFYALERRHIVVKNPGEWIVGL